VKANDGQRQAEALLGLKAGKDNSAARSGGQIARTQNQTQSDTVAFTNRFVTSTAPGTPGGA